MTTFIEALYKAEETITLGWNPEPLEEVTSFRVYVSQVPGTASMVDVFSGRIPNQASKNSVTLGKVAIDAGIVAIRDVLGLPDTLNFGNLLLYWTLTSIDAAGTESDIADSIVVTIPPVGVTGRTMKDDPTINRHLFGFSDSLQKWTKLSASDSGALITDPSDYYAANTITEYTYDAGNVATEKIYLSDRTSAGSPAKLITNEYSGSDLIKITVTDSTV